MNSLGSSLIGRLIAVLLIVPPLWNVALSKPPSAATVVALDPGVTAGVGSPLEFVEYEAENGATNGRIVGPDRTFTTLASEASGRRAVLLEGQGDYVEFTRPMPLPSVMPSPTVLRASPSMRGSACTHLGFG